LQQQPSKTLECSQQGVHVLSSPAAALQGVAATQLRHALADEAEARPFMTQQELLQFIIAQ
jgi:hypothetical protein